MCLWFPFLAFVETSTGCGTAGAAAAGPHYPPRPWRRARPIVGLAGRAGRDSALWVLGGMTLLGPRGHVLSHRLGRFTVTQRPEEESMMAA
ncbi:hypothetical protein GQ607_015350 [Colletotrichum asianum]|uniref:Secreted protein n=1 Tax=Colletotrichum asianum TaxID=702518 RepID=A0A8H3VXT2_9PEZI|nr:hypothetical protein GQ607_015350 [Colletotrichum asianum]